MRVIRMSRSNQTNHMIDLDSVVSVDFEVIDGEDTIQLRTGEQSFKFTFRDRKPAKDHYTAMVMLWTGEIGETFEELINISNYLAQEKEREKVHEFAMKHGLFNLKTRGEPIVPFKMVVNEESSEEDEEEETWK